jgi:putative transposase
MADLKLVYGAPTLDDAKYRLEEFREKWGKKYPQILKSWDTNWTELSTYFKYPQEVRTLIYTTNAVEGFHRMLRKYTKNKVIYPTDDSVKKSVYLSIMEISEKWSMSKTTQASLSNWGIIMGQLSVFFEDRLQGRNVS